MQDALPGDGSTLDGASIRGLWKEHFPDRTLDSVRNRMRSIHASNSCREKGPITKAEGETIVRVYNEQRGARGWLGVAGTQLGRTSKQVHDWKSRHISLFRAFGTESSSSGGGGSGDKEEKSDEDLN